MTYDETIKLMSVLKAAYPSYYKGMSRSEADGIVAIWCRMLEDLPGDVVMAAAERMIAMLKFPPTIADIRSSVSEAISEASGDLSAGDAWAKVLKAASLYGFYQPDKARSFLGDRLWQAVEMIGGWSYFCTTDDALTTLSAQFERRYKAALEQHKNAVQIPQTVRTAMSAMVEKLTLPGFKQPEDHQTDVLPLGKQAETLKLLESTEGVNDMGKTNPLTARDLRQKADEADQKRRLELEGGRPMVAGVYERMRDAFRDRADRIEQAAVVSEGA